MSQSRQLPGFQTEDLKEPISPTARLTPWAGYLILCLIVVLAIRIAALYVNRTDLFFDEAQYWSWSLEPAFGYYSKPPLIAWIIGLGTALCGTSEFCIRLPSPIIHAATSIAVFFAAARLYDPKTGFWSGLVYATLPGVSVSSSLISTDVPLLFFWAVALYAFAALIQNGKSLWPVLLLGLAIGCGLNAKYAMAYFVLCALIYGAATPEQRWIFKDWRWWLALALGIAMIVPNLAWNARNSFSTFAHTADNAKWDGALFHPVKGAEFFVSQFGVFGPILFGTLLIICWRAYHRGLPAPDRLLLAFALPVVIIVTVQAFLSRAHANWAAVSYVAATILVTATMLREASTGWLKTSLGLHLLVVSILAVGFWQAGTFTHPWLDQPFVRTLGWKELAQKTAIRLNQAKAAGRPYAAILTFERAVTAELLFYLRGEKTPVYTWPPLGRPKDHYQLTRSLPPGIKGPLLLVSLRPAPEKITDRFTISEPDPTETVATGRFNQRRIQFVRLSAQKLQKISPHSTR